MGYSMNFKSIIDEWERDSKIDPVNLDEESIKIPQLHSKYLKYLVMAAAEYRQANRDYKMLYCKKRDYYLGYLDSDTLNQLGWEPVRLKILKNEIEVYLDADPDLNQALEVVEATKSKADYLERVLKELNNRQFQIKNSIEWHKFKNGLN